ncbi:hypothetical protein CTEN210_12478 [Chaetoceros tenuissimus]|uniref:F-box domain-containing protein n=1 Tax=Chaetoceros tenuissimus TaxID=426638 RepID=A0AAD3D1Q7_9STRA|nr:hypothetical protein CTEN210_12478 [Chaetoceros tenuissimus]
MKEEESTKKYPEVELKNLESLPSSDLLFNIPTEVLEMILSYIGVGHFGFVVLTSKQFYNAYTSFCAKYTEAVDKNMTFMSSSVASMTCFEMYLEQSEFLQYKHVTENDERNALFQCDDYDDGDVHPEDFLDRRLETALKNIMKCAASVGNLNVIQWAHAYIENVKDPDHYDDDVEDNYIKENYRNFWADAVCAAIPSKQMKVVTWIFKNAVDDVEKAEKMKKCNVKAAFYGDVDTMKYFLMQKISWSDDMFRAAVVGNQLDALKWIHCNCPHSFKGNYIVEDHPDWKYATQHMPDDVLRFLPSRPNRLVEWITDYHSSKSLCALAAQNCNLEMTTFLMVNDYPFYDIQILAYNACVANDFDAMKWLDCNMTIGSWGPSELNAVVAHGNVEAIHWLRNKRCEFNHETSVSAIRSGNVEIIRFLHEQGCVFDERSMQIAVENSNVELMDYLMSIGCPILGNHIREVKTKLNTVVWEWLINNGTPLMPDDTLSVARIGSVKTMKWLHSYIECPWHLKAAEEAAHAGDLEMLKYLYSVGYPLTQELCEKAASGSINFRGLNIDNREVLKWLYASCNHFSDSVSAAATKYSGSANLRCLIELGCGISSVTFETAVREGNLSCMNLLLRYNCTVDSNSTIAAIDFALRARHEREGFGMLNWLCKKECCVIDQSVLEYMKENTDHRRIGPVIEIIKREISKKTQA